MGLAVEKWFLRKPNKALHTPMANASRWHVKNAWNTPHTLSLGSAKKLIFISGKLRQTETIYKDIFPSTQWNTSPRGQVILVWFASTWPIHPHTPQHTSILHSAVLAIGQRLRWIFLSLKLRMILYIHRCVNLRHSHQIPGYPTPRFYMWKFSKQLTCGLTANREFVNMAVTRIPSCV